VSAQRARRLVVFAGAGISMGAPSDIPDFGRLADLISGGTLTRPPEEPLDLCVRAVRKVERWGGRAEQGANSSLRLGQGFAAGETFYVMAGAGTVSVGNETAPIAVGDALPIRVGEAKAFENTCAEPLELLVIGVARDMEAKTALMMSSSGAQSALAGGRGGPGRGNRPRVQR